MPTTDYTEFLHNVKQEYITNSYELDGIFIFDIELPAPPRTAFGMLATTAANLGNKPNKIKITPDAATTKRLLTRVTAIRPTF